MARDFDGANDQVAFGSDTSIDSLNPKSICMWVKQDATVFRFFLGKDRFAGAWGLGSDSPGGHTDKLYWQQNWSTAAGAWVSTTQVGTTLMRHVAVTYNNSATTNDPLMWIDGVTDTVIQLGADPVGSVTSDAAANLIAGENGANAADFDGQIGWLCFTNVAFTDADVNRGRWWGRPGGGLKVYHPWMTTKLTNEGTATATGTATGTTVVNMPCPVVRPGTILLGLGVGW